ncbi:MAG: serpin family protein [Lachnospiraceae bacterium]|jgi:serpin B|nr:serpin family protein [Lachnospiraceae bacterium]
MKKKLLILLCACMALSGCSDVGTGNPQGSSGQEISGSRQEDPSGQSQGNGNQGISEQGNGNQGISEQGNGNQGSSEQGENGQGNSGQSQGSSEQGGSGEVRKLGANGDHEIIPVELENAYQKAAYFADQVYQEKGGNILVSPLSLNVALGMVAEGTTGETAAELYRYLGGETYADWVDQYLAFAEGLEAHEDDQYSKYSFSYKLANSIWVRKGDKLSENYRKLVQKKFRAEAENVDFVNEAEATANKINSWCDEHTEGLIKEVVKPDMFSPGLAAVLVNSLYFESPWVKQWIVNQREFTNLAGKKTTQDMLVDYSLSKYFENEHCTAFAKNYYNGFEFIGILPKEEGDFSLSDLDLKSLMESRTEEYDVRAIMPKLEFETMTENVVDILKAEGVLKIFDPACEEFDKMVEGRSLFVSDILQKCKIELDEEGTRAAAVTVILAKDTAAFIEPVQREIKEVFLDRPFAFLIYDSNNDQILFAGKVTDIQ